MEKELNQKQEECLKHQKGPCLVVAPPGSGKTMVITARTKYLIEHYHVEPSNILVITFTKAAAGEMKIRFDALVGEEHKGVSFGTFHSIFFRILKFAYRYEAKDIVREEQRIQVIKELMGQYEVAVEDEAEFIASILSEISSVKGEMINLEYYYAKNCSEEIFKKLYRGYETKLREARKIDFDDMLVMCYQLLLQRKDILEAWQKKYQYILIDEFQDINRVQYEIIRMLAQPEHNLFIVGDDDQSIYRFRGAKPEIMLGFEKDYPEAKRVVLNVNYRSAKTIVETADQLIRSNKTRFEKIIMTNRRGGRPVETKLWKDAQEETLSIVKDISDYVKLGCPLSEIAVLYRTNQGPRLLVERLMEYNIPFRMRDSLPNLYEHWIAQNILTYIRVACGQMERGKILQIINRPKRYVSRDSMNTSTVSWEAIKSFYQDKGWMIERIEKLEYDLGMIRKMAPVAAVNYIRKAVEYDDYLKEYAEFRRMKPEELMEVADQLQESAAAYRTYEAWFHHMEEYKKRLLQQSQSTEQKIDGVSLMTMHSSKGLEFNVVFIPDANEGVTPHQKAVLEADLEEERRMFYVAMTRAKDHLRIYAVKDRYGKKQEVSRFVKEYLRKPDDQKKI